MAAASGHGGTLGEVVLSVVVTLAVYWIAERYASILAAGVHGSAPTWAGVRSALRQGWPMVQAAIAPLVVLLTASFFTTLQTGVMVALVFATVLLAGLGWRAARRVGAGALAAAGWAVASGLLGVIVIGLKLLLH